MDIVNKTFIVVSQRYESLLIEDVSTGMGPGYGPLYLIKAVNTNGPDAKLEFLKLTEKEVKS